MIEANRTLSLLLPEGYRGAGVLFHVTSLPSPYGIGDLGPSAFAWIDRLAEAGQGWWQILPLGPTGLGHSPYDPLSTFAGNLMLISPDRLQEDGLLVGQEVPSPASTSKLVQFCQVSNYKRQLLDAAWDRFRSGRFPALADAFADFAANHADWLEDFATFIALKRHHQGAFFYHWPEPLARHDERAVRHLAQTLRDTIEYVKFNQFLFFRQWHALKAYAELRGIRLLGDLPFFVSHDSAEVWASPELFLLKEDRHPVVVAGVPPDYFSSTGQLWGNPIYDWGAMHETGYAWWIRRMRRLFQLVDAVRLDHFRAFAAAWQIPAGAPTAETGEWVPGPGAEFLGAARRALGGLPLVAEDLGLITDDVLALRDAFHLPGMKVLQFAFDGDPKNPFLPDHYEANSVAFTGTHDNDTTRGWFQKLNPDGQRVVANFFGPQIDESTIAREMLQTVWASKSGLAITPFQDILNLDSSARMNIPGLAEGNWNWRAESHDMAPQVFDALARLTADAGRWQTRSRV